MTRITRAPARCTSVRHSASVRGRNVGEATGAASDVEQPAALQRDAEGALEARQAAALVRAVVEADRDDLAPARNAEHVPVVVGVVPLEAVGERLSGRA